MALIDSVFDSKVRRANSIFQTAAFRDPAVFPDPEEVKLDRPTDVYQMWSMGPHGCAGRAIAITALAAMTKACAQLKNLRRAPGDQGQIKYVPGPVGSRRYLSDDWSRYQPFAGSKCLPLLLSVRTVEDRRLTISTLSSQPGKCILMTSTRSNRTIPVCRL